VKIVTILGARPQFIKAAALSRLVNSSSQIDEIIVHTGQHFDTNMSEIFFEEMSIPKPSYNLNINSLSHGAMTGRMLEGIESILLKEKPDITLVYGDTNSTLAGALASKKLNIPVAHVEAGLRSWNNRMPEETNRIITDRISDFLFCPSRNAIQNLEQEGITNKGHRVYLCGDIMYDAALYYSSESRLKSNIIQKLNVDKFVLCTIHREENTNDLNRLSSIFDALEIINKEIKVIIPIHPRTRKIIQQNGLENDLTLIEPVGYFDMLELIKNCQMGLTDSGGLQKELYFFNKPCITLRDETEWIELVNSGVNFIAGSNKTLIQKYFNQAFSSSTCFTPGIYGSGCAANAILEAIQKL